MPLFRVRWTGADAEEGQWHDDPYGCFTERYFVNGELTGYVRTADDPATLIWDLGFSGRILREGREAEVDRLVLSDGGRWLELADEFLRFGWSAYPHRGEACVFAAVHALERFQAEIMPDPEQVELTVQAAIHRRGGVPAPPGAPGWRVNSGFSVSIAFGREHGPVLQDLRMVLERRIGRRLAGHETPPPPGPRAYPEPASPPPAAPPASLATVHKEEAAAPGVQDGDAVTAVKRSRPGARTLALIVDTVPDTPDWLSFTGPTTLELLASRSAGPGPGAGAEAGTAAGADADAPDPTVVVSPPSSGRAAGW